MRLGQQGAAARGQKSMKQTAIVGTRRVATSAVLALQPLRPERVRFAPSPTGELHLGGVRTALYNMLLARASGGEFILRIEDTDRRRKVDGAVARISAALMRAGLCPDEGPEGGGSCGPYVQSQRLEHYSAAAAQLLERGFAYRCFCGAARLEHLRADARARGVAPIYDRCCAALAPSVAARRVAAGEAHVLRLSAVAALDAYGGNSSGEVILHDRLRGRISWRAVRQTLS
eukprot:SAG11_NODE_2194_length_3702_cov_1.574799_1_plen_231_part_00